MPYVRDEIRKRYRDALEALVAVQRGDMGDVAFCIFYLVKSVMMRKMAGGYTPTFEERARVLGMLEATVAEFKQKFIIEYEREKRETNGDI